MNAKNGKHRRRVRMRGQMTAPQLRQWAAGERKICHWCGARCETYEIDHIVPLSKGGQHKLDNLAISCPTCNRRKGARCPVEFAQSIGEAV